MSGDLTVDVVRTPEALAALGAEWTGLWRRMPDATPFQAAAWLVPWARHLGSGDLRVVTLRREGWLVGLVPLFRWGEKLLPLGIGNSDYLDVLVEERGAGDLDAAFAALARLGEGRVEFHQVPAGSRLRTMPPPPGWTVTDGAGVPCPVLEPPGAVPAHMVQNYRYYRRRAARVGRLEIGPAPDPEAAFAALSRLHAARWAELGQPGVLAEPAVQAFHRAALPRLRDMGALRLYELRLDGRIAAVWYGFAAGGRFYYYLSGFDPERAHLGLGTLIVGHAIAEAVREGATEFHFLRGREAYKYRWGAKDRPTWWRRWIREEGAA